MRIKSIILLYYLTSKPPSANTFGPDELQAINPKYDFKLRLSFSPFFLLPFSKLPAKRKINAIDKKNLVTKVCCCRSNHKIRHFVPG
ncbi:hypothetical protein SHAL103562_02125 [Shewanella algae]|nr:hypothetical protein TUM3811_20170 [Shewanella algae]